MRKIIDYEFNIDEVTSRDIFICTIGFETRSRHLLDKMRKEVDSDGILVLSFNDLKQNDEISKYIEGLEKDSITVELFNYEQGYCVLEKIVTFLDDKQVENRKVYIDYSSMPRLWYSMLPVKLREKYDFKVLFLYVVGEYPVDYKAYPSAGVESYSQIGMPSLRDNKRLHVIGIGYDSVRTEGVLSILDPDIYTVCTAYYSGNNEMERQVKEVNQQSIEQAVSCVSMHTDDFSYMTARLCEIAIEYLPLGDVIFVPDGPKPLIMAMSLVPQLLGKKGVVCIRIARNSQCHELIDVKPTDTILCFGLE